MRKPSLSNMTGLQVNLPALCGLEGEEDEWPLLLRWYLGWWLVP